MIKSVPEKPITTAKFLINKQLQKETATKKKNKENTLFCTTTYKIKSQLYNNRCITTNYYFSFDH